ncbi:MAG: PilZ domain-containing protein, partial [Sandaracinaceae bacterium]
MSEERAGKRVAIETTVRFRTPMLADFVDSYSGNVSQEGLFIRHEEPLKKSTLLKLEIELEDETLSAVGRVVWVRRPTQASDDSPPGMGIKFVKLDAAAKDKIAALVETRGMEGPGTFARSEGASVDSAAPAGASVAAPGSAGG